MHSLTVAALNWIFPIAIVYVYINECFLERIPTPEVFPESELSGNITLNASQNDWMPTTIVVLMIVSASLIM